MLLFTSVSLEDSPGVPLITIFKGFPLNVISALPYT
jgi:hypothetical protein